MRQRQRPQRSASQAANRSDGSMAACGSLVAAQASLASPIRARSMDFDRHVERSSVWSLIAGCEAERSARLLVSHCAGVRVCVRVHSHLLGDAVEHVHGCGWMWRDEAAGRGQRSVTRRGGVNRERGARHREKRKDAPGEHRAKRGQNEKRGIEASHDY